MLLSGWDFLKDPNNQAVLTWIGGGIAAVATAIFAVVKFRAKKPPPEPSNVSRSVIATTIHDSSININ